DELHEVAKSIREIVQEEMLHMALACNMLAAVGGSPSVNSHVPSYPTKLPGGVHTHLTVELMGLCEPALAMFMEIERPHKPIPVPTTADEESTVIDTTVGEFYEQIEKAFEILEPKIHTDRQIAGPKADFVITSISDAKKAIALIRKQGEGSEESPEDTGIDD